MTATLTDELTLTEAGRRLSLEQYALLADVRDRVVTSLRDAKSAPVQTIRDGYVTDVSADARALEAAGLVRRGKKSWFLTPAGQTLLNKRAGRA